MKSQTHSSVDPPQQLMGMIRNLLDQLSGGPRLAKPRPGFGQNTCCPKD